MEDYQALLDRIREQERLLRFSEFSYGTAIALGNAILERAVRLDKQIVVDIRRNGQVVFHAKMDGTGPNNDRWIERKLNVVNHFGHSSYYMHVLYKSWNTTIQENAYVDAMEYSAEGGCFPILMANVEGPIGSIAVSGLTGPEDHEMITDTLAEFLGIVY